MASSGNHLCTLCQEDDDVDNVAVTWCIDCETFLCFDCAMIEVKRQKNTEHSPFKIIKIYLHSFLRPAIAARTMTKGMNCTVEFTSVHAVFSALKTFIKIVEI